MRASLTLAGPGAQDSHFALITIDEVKDYLQDQGIGTTLDLPILTPLVAALCRMAHYEMGGRFILDTTEWDQIYDGPGGDRIYLENRPLVSVASIETGSYSFGSWQPYSTFLSSDYVAMPQVGAIQLIGSSFFSDATMSNRIKYRAGFAAAPHDLKHALKEWAVVEMKRLLGDRLDVTTISHETETKVFTADSMPQQARAILNRYAYKERTIA